MDEPLIQIVHDVDEARNSGVCRACLLDVLVSALNGVLGDVGDPAARAAAAAALEAPSPRQ